MSVRRANQTNPLEAKRCERPDQLEILQVSNAYGTKHEKKNTYWRTKT